MRNIRTYPILATLFLVFVVQGQDRRERRAKTSFENYEFIKAIRNYENLVKKGTTSPEIYRNLGDANYFNANYSEAAKWYGLVSENDTEPLGTEHMYRYANSLGSIKNYEASSAVLRKIYERNGEKMGVTFEGFKRSIEEKQGSYEIENIAINSIESDFAPSFRLDGIVFSTARDSSIIYNSTHNWNKKRFLNLYMATRTEEGRFRRIMRFSDKLNTRLHESSTAFTQDGKTVYFTRNREKGKTFGRDSKGISRLKLYSAVFEDGKWRRIQQLPFNQEGYSVAHPALNKAEDKLYFTSDIEGTQGQSDIFVVDIHPDGSFGVPKNLGAKINTGGRETFPYVTEDDILYFASDGHPGLGGLDIFAVDLKTIESSRIVNLGEPLNSVADDFSFIINPNTKKGYFASNRAGGMGSDDIYALTELKALDTRCFIHLAGVVKDKETDAFIQNTTVTLLDGNGSIRDETHSDANGEYALTTECQETDYVLVASKDGYASDKRTISMGTMDFSNIVLHLVPEDNGTPIGTDLTKHLGTNPIYFDFNTSYLRHDAKMILEKIIAYLNTYPKAKVEIRSHTDSRGHRAYNKVLSQKRARETLNYLLSKDISITRVSSVGMGESQLTNRCDGTIKCTEKEHRKNRRSEFILVE